LRQSCIAGSSMVVHIVSRDYSPYQLDSAIDAKADSDCDVTG
jgi:hypothetical protein